MCGSFGQVAACTPAQQRRPGGRACCTHGLPLPRQEQRLGGGQSTPGVQATPCSLAALAISSLHEPREPQTPTSCDAVAAPESVAPRELHRDADSEAPAVGWGSTAPADTAEQKSMWTKARCGLVSPVRSQEEGWVGGG